MRLLALNTMAEKVEEQPSQAQRLEAEAEAGPGANAQSVDQNESTVDTELEKTTNTSAKTATGPPNPSPSESSEVIAEPNKEEPATDEPHRSKGRTALLMGALAVCYGHSRTAGTLY